MTPQKVMCARCGGLGGAEASDFSMWHPCLHCNTEGVCSCIECLVEAHIVVLKYRLQVMQEYLVSLRKTLPSLRKNEPPVCDEDIPW